MISCEVVQFKALSFKDRKKIVDNWNLEKIEKRLKKYMPADFDIPASIAEYRKFILLLSAENHWLYVPNPELDEVWHTHLLFSRDYKKLCEALLGEGGFIHHQPEDGEERKMSDGEKSTMCEVSIKILGDVPFRIGEYITSEGEWCWTC